ncbi:HvfC/BufC N-terminal domain-containing protein [Sphaerotilus hippei]|nr:DNA-binding domain-containing protein [Sphaerotilus hippei]
MNTTPSTGPVPAAGPDAAGRDACHPAAAMPPGDWAAELALTLLDPDRPAPPGLVTRNGSDPAQRLGMHRNNVVVSLVDALADTFAVTRALVGEDFFRAMARVFVRRHPPRTRILNLWGEAFPAFIATFPPAAGLPFLADVARLEHARVLACHAADVPALDPAALGRWLARPEALPALRLGLHPSVRLLCSPHAIVSLWAAHQDLLDLARVDPGRGENALVFREGLVVQVQSIGAGDAGFIRTVLAGGSLAEAATRIDADDPQGLTGPLLTLIRHQLVTAAA